MQISTVRYTQSYTDIRYYQIYKYKVIWIIRLGRLSLGTKVCSGSSTPCSLSHAIAAGAPGCRCCARRTTCARTTHTAVSPKTKADKADVADVETEMIRLWNQPDGSDDRRLRSPSLGCGHGEAKG